MSDPGLGSTYRVQLHALGFERARTLVPYLSSLGIETLYLSPVLAAVPGSEHGYDVIDPRRIDPALGTEAEFFALLDELRAHNMRALLDIVPNHMAAVPENSWWWDVLLRGPDSAWARSFDIDWAAHGGRVLVPVLSRPLAEVFEAGAYVVDRPHEVLDLEGTPFPLASGAPEGDVAEVLRHQHYHPAYWRLGATEGNYRRFFDINTLIGMRVEDPDVFEATHAVIIALAQHPAVAGVRVDHVDGLADPKQYLAHLSSRMPRGREIVIEKILGQEETLDPTWPVLGTSGYEFADRVTALFVDAEGGARLHAAGERFCGGGDWSFSSLSRQAKREVLERLFCTDVNRLAHQSVALLDEETPGHDLSEQHLRLAWTELTVKLPIYRTYIDGGGASETDETAIDCAVRGPHEDPETARAIATLARALLDRAKQDNPWLAIAQRWQQLSGAAMAKGSEDTATYRYPGLLARAEVGGDPDASGNEVDLFHQFAGSRAGGLNSTSTHDSKRNEDARCRLAVLSEADAEWIALTERWHAVTSAGTMAPHPVEELAIYQSFLSLWPTVETGLDAMTLSRVIGQAIKGAREAKLRTSWTAPDGQYEDALARFVTELHADRPFCEEMTAFARCLAPSALANALASVALKICAPGVPDFYQGSELLEPTLTDPDNRRPVDFARRTQVMASLPEPSESGASELLSRWDEGAIKMYVTRTLLRHRRGNASLYRDGDYAPLFATTNHVIAFRRSLPGHGAIVCVVPRLTQRLGGPGTFAIGEEVWGDHSLVDPESTGRYRDILTERTIEATPDKVLLSRVFGVLPVAVLRETA